MNYRLAAMGVITASAIAITSTSIANAGTDPASPGAQKTGDDTSKPVDPATAGSDVADAARELGVTQEQLLAALGSAKQAAVATGTPASPGRVNPDVDAAAASLADSLHVSRAAARRAFMGLLNTPKTVSGPAEAPRPETVAELASFLDISSAQAQRVLAAGDHGLEPGSSAFAALADSLGMTTAELLERLRAFKTSSAGSQEVPEAKTSS